MDETKSESTEETKVGARNSANDQGRLQMIHDYAVENGAYCGEEPKSIDVNDILVTFGSTVKALGDGRVGGYLVRFSTEQDPDLEGDFFTKDTDFGDFKETDLYFHHRQPVEKDGKVFHFKQTIGKGKLSIDDVGVFMDAVIEMRGEYEQAVKEIYSNAFMKLVEMEKLGLSSGTAGHLVDREPRGKAWWIKKWPLALDASITPTPAEYRTSVIPLKSLYKNITDESEAEKVEVINGGEAEAVLETIQTDEHNKEYIMANENEEAGKVEQPAPVKNTEIDYDLLASKVAEKIDRPLESKALEAKAVIKPENLGDPDPYKALTRWAKGGSAKGLGALGAKIDDSGEALHFGYTKAALQEDTAGEGGNLVPNDFYAGIIAKRDQMSIPRRAGATIFRTSRDIIDIPYEDTSMTDFVKTAEEGAYDQNEPTFGNAQVNVYKYTKLIKMSEELVEDQEANLDSFLTESIGRAWGLTENSLTLTANGSSTVQGVFVGGSVGYTFADTNGITAAEIASLFWSLGDPYHEGASWVMKGATMGYLQGLTGNPFSFVTTPVADTFKNQFYGNKPYYLSDSAAAIATGAKTVLIGNWAFYALVERRGLTMSRNPYLYQGNGQIGLFCSVRMGGKVLQSEAFKWGIQT